MHIHQEGPSTSPEHAGALATTGGQTKARRRRSFPLNRSRLSVDRLVTSLGIDKILAFRVFDRTIIFGHWLSKTQNLELASRAFPFEKGFYCILVDHFQKGKKSFFQKSFFKKMALGYLHIGLYRFPHMLYCFPSHVKIG